MSVLGTPLLYPSTSLSAPIIDVYALISQDVGGSAESSEHLQVAESPGTGGWLVLGREGWAGPGCFCFLVSYKNQNTTQNKTKTHQSEQGLLSLLEILDNTR